MHVQIAALGVAVLAATAAVLPVAQCTATSAGGLVATGGDGGLPHSRALAMRRRSRARKIKRNQANERQKGGNNNKKCRGRRCKRGGGGNGTRNLQLATCFFTK